MRSSLIILLFLSSLSLAQRSDGGKRNGYDWKRIGTSLGSIQRSDSPEVQSWIPEIRAQAKRWFILGIGELCTRMPTQSNGQDATFQPDKSSSFYPYLLGTTPDQIVIGLDKFYEDPSNMNVLILDAIHIVQMQIMAQPQQDIDWQILFHRSDDSTRRQMLLDKQSKEKK